MKSYKIIGLSVALFMSSVVLAASSQAIQFAKGANSAIVKGYVQGYHDARYTLRANAGQELSAVVQRGNVYANVYAPGDLPGQAEAIMNVGELPEKLVLPETGNYVVQVYQMRNDARKNKKQSFAVKVAVTTPHDAQNASAATPTPAPKAGGQDKKSVRALQFAKGKSSASVSGKVRGYDGTLYSVQARAGQKLTVILSGYGAYVNVYAPNDMPGEAEAIFDGSVDGNPSLTLPADGRYILQVYQMRNTARSGKVVPFRLNVSIK